MDVYLWVKAGHIIAVISWMAGLLYLPRLFVYHSEVPVESAQSQLFNLMQQRLLSVIMLPAMAASWIFGLIMLTGMVGPGFVTDGWAHAKLFFVILLTLYHAYLGSVNNNFQRGFNKKSKKFFIIVNEIPTVIMIITVVIVVVKPF